MSDFTQWNEALILLVSFSLIVLVPCTLIGFIGHKHIEKLGNNPSQGPIIQMSVFFKLFVIELFSFASLLAFYQLFS